MENTCYRTAIYCRLSREDGNEESQSIQAQKSVLTEYVQKQGWQIVDIYADDGFSGTNFDRPDFMRLLEDIEQGKIDLVITKDLSRLGRNYILTGYYVEEFFPEHNVRYIALNDSYDTLNEDGNEFVPFKNIINEWYAKDISKKIRFTLNNNAKNGVCKKTNHPLFGYNYNSAYERIPDPDTAPIVQLIYKKFIETSSTIKVAEFLKENHIKIPLYYNAIKFDYNKKKVMSMTEEELTDWNRDSIRQIIKNDAYLGTYRTSLTKSVNYKIKKRTKNKDCYIFENRFEPLIDRETWEIANKIMGRTRSGTIPLEENVFKGLVFCKDCHQLMRFEQQIDRKTNDRHIGKYYCVNKLCNCRNTIRKNFLIEVVRNELIELKSLILDKEDEFIAFAENYNSKGRNLELDIEKEISKINRKNKEVDMFIQKLFEQNVKGIIPQSTYDMMMSKYTKEKEMYEEQLKELARKNNAQLKEQYKEKSYLNLIETLKSVDLENDLTPQIIQKLIKKIEVSGYSINNCRMKRRFDIVIYYSNCNEMIREFEANEE